MENKLFFKNHRYKNGTAANEREDRDGDKSVPRDGLHKSGTQLGEKLGDVLKNSSIYFVSAGSRKQFPGKKLTKRSVPAITKIFLIHADKEETIMDKTVLVPVAQGTEEMEAITIIDVLRRSGTKVVVASVDDIEVKGSQGTEFKADVLIKDCMDDRFDLIALPGGIPGAMNLRDSKELEILLKRQADQSMLYGAICASPAVVLHHHGLVTPGNVTCHPGFADQIDKGNIRESKVVVDGNCITSRGAGTACDFALTLVELLYSEDRKKQVMQGLALLVD